MTFNEQNEKMLELKGKIRQLEEELHTIKQENKEINQKYLNLRARYTLQNDELIRLKVLFSKEGYSENNNRYSKK